MVHFPSGFWGPRPRWAIAPLVVVMAVLGWVVSRPDADGPGPLAVTALKPLPPGSVTEAGDEATSMAGRIGGMPIEVRYGVPSPRTARYWAEPMPG